MITQKPQRKLAPRPVRYCDDYYPECPECGSGNVTEDNGQKGELLWHELTCHDCGHHEENDNF